MGNPKANRVGLSSPTLRSSFRYAWRGIVTCWSTQRNFRIHVFCAWAVLGLALLMQLSPLEVSLLVVVSIGVLLAELLNTAIELLLDLLVPDYAPAVGHIKNTAAGAVLVTAVAAAGVGLAVLGPQVRDVPLLLEQALRQYPLLVVAYGLLTLAVAVVSLRTPLRRI